MAMHAIAVHFGRPGTPTDQAPIESFFGHVKRDWPHLTVLTNSAELTRELDGVREDYNGRRLSLGVDQLLHDVA